MSHQARRGVHRARGVRHRRVPLRTRARTQRGAALVEAVLITPIFLLVLFGTFEFSLALRDYLALQSGSRAAVRVGSTAGNAGMADFDLLAAYKQGAKALQGSSTLSEIVVWKATGPNDTLSAGDPCLTSSVAGRCNRYDASSLTQPSTKFGCGTGTLDGYWCPTTRKIRQSDPPDYIGVYVRIVHQNPTGIFGASRTFTEQNVMRLEPQRL